MAKRKKANSVRELATAVGRAHTTVLRWLEHPDWALPRKPPWDVERVRKWAQTHLVAAQGDDGGDGAAVAEPGPSGLEALRRQPMQAAKLKLTLTRASKLELERRILAGELIDRREVEEAMVRRVYAAKAAFQSLPRQMAPRLVGKSEVEIERILAEGIDACLLELSQQTELPPLPNE